MSVRSFTSYVQESFSNQCRRLTLTLSFILCHGIPNNAVQVSPKSRETFAI
uniref:Uncharacterized protein n=1 Tax=Anguilla anguilla TaxID=7936 RepID=A0A0E9SJ22_ANGAN